MLLTVRLSKQGPTSSKPDIELCLSEDAGCEDLKGLAAVALGIEETNASKLKMEVELEALEETSGEENSPRKKRMKKKSKKARRSEGFVPLKTDSLLHAIKPNSFLYVTNWNKLSSKKSIKIAQKILGISGNADQLAILQELIETSSWAQFPSALSPESVKALELIGVPHAISPKHMKTLLQSVIAMSDPTVAQSIRYVTSDRPDEETVDFLIGSVDSLSLSHFAYSDYSESEIEEKEVEIMSASVPSGQIRRERRRRRRARISQGRANDLAFDDSFFDFDFDMVSDDFHMAPPPGLPQHLLETLPVQRLFPGDVLRLQKLNLHCPICLEPYNIEELVMRLPCFHQFHQPCIERWLQTSSCCPQDRIEIKPN